MQLKVEGQKEPIMYYDLNYISEGKDGMAYGHFEEIIKLTISGYMTPEKLRDLRFFIPDKPDIRIVPPRKIILDPCKVIPTFKTSKLFGYTQRKLPTIENGILKMTTDEYLREFDTIRKQSAEYLSKNSIGIMDTNPMNVLPATLNNSTALFMIDLDRYITPSCSYYEKGAIKDGDYFKHNRKKLALIMYKVLLLQIQEEQKEIKRYINQEEKRTDITFTEIEKMLLPYSCIEEYAQESRKKIKRKGNHL